MQRAATPSSHTPTDAAGHTGSHRSFNVIAASGIAKLMPTPARDDAGACERRARAIAASHDNRVRVARSAYGEDHVPTRCRAQVPLANRALDEHGRRAHVHDRTEDPSGEAARSGRTGAASAAPPRFEPLSRW
jgi:hypothetical protein